MVKRPVVLATRKLPEAVETRLARDYAARLNPSDAVYDAEALLGHADGCDALLVSPTEALTKALIERLPERVRIIASFSVGYDHIDLKAAKARGIAVTNTPDVLTNATADIAMLLVLGAARRAGEGEALMRAGRWERWGPTHMLGTEVSGKRLGIVGFGRIGRAVARRARGFDMEIHYHDVVRAPREAESGAVFHRALETMLPLCDFLSLHCPSSEHTKGFLNAERIALLPDGAIVVNTARGDIVDDEALITALESGKLAAAGLDVYRGEPRIHPRYRTLVNTFLLPHLGSATRETRNAMGFRALDNLDAFFAGREPLDRVT